MNCIFCGEEVSKNSLEHIVPESLGNLYYILQLGAICRSCNNSFSDFEDKALGKTMLGFERTRLGIITKKGKAAQAKSHNIQFVGDSNFRKNRVTVFGIDEKDIEEVTPEGVIKVRILDFDKSDMATSKLLLKIGLESLYQSRRKIFKKHDYIDLREHLNKVNNNSWPLLTTHEKLNGFVSIPRFMDKKRLKNIKCEILFKEINEETLLLQFKYSILSYVVNILSRDIAWVQDYINEDPLAQLYPEHLRKKIMKLT